MNDGWWWMNEVHVVGYGIQISVLFTDVQQVEFFYWKWAYCLVKVVVLITQPIFRKHLSLLQMMMLPSDTAHFHKQMAYLVELFMLFLHSHNCLVILSHVDVVTI